MHFHFLKNIVNECDGNEIFLNQNQSNQNYENGAIGQKSFKIVKCFFSSIQQALTIKCIKF